MHLVSSDYSYKHALRFSRVPGMDPVSFQVPCGTTGIRFEGEKNISNAYTGDIEIASETTLLYIKLNLFLRH